MTDPDRDEQARRAAIALVKRVPEDADFDACVEAAGVLKVGEPWRDWETAIAVNSVKATIDTLRQRGWTPPDKAQQRRDAAADASTDNHRDN